MDYLSVCAIFKQENPFLKEWLDYYAPKIDSFYLCCNDEDDKEAKSIIKPYNVHYYHQVGEELQMGFYNQILKEAKSRWIAFIDLDEFIVNIHNLEHYEQYGGLVLNMICFGANGLIEFPISQTQQLTKRLPDHCGWPGHSFIKSIVNPDKVVRYDNQPHAPIYRDAFAVNTKHEIVTGHFTTPEVSEVMRINHYYTRSREWWEVKMNRGHADNKNNKYYWHDFLTIEKNATVTDNTLAVPSGL